MYEHLNLDFETFAPDSDFQIPSLNFEVPKTFNYNKYRESVLDLMFEANDTDIFDTHCKEQWHNKRIEFFIKFTDFEEASITTSSKYGKRTPKTRKDSSLKIREESNVDSIAYFVKPQMKMLFAENLKNLETLVNNFLKFLGEVSLRVIFIIQYCTWY